MATQGNGKARRDFAMQIFVAELFAENLQTISTRAAGLQYDCSVEPIHQIRVAVRRLRAHLDSFSPILQKQSMDDSKNELKWLDSVLAPVRNCDVMLELLASQRTSARFAKSGVADLKIRLIQELIAQREQQAVALLEQLRCWQDRSITSEQVAVLEQPSVRRSIFTLSSQGQADAIAQCLESELSKMMTLARKSLRHPSPRRLHRVRIQAKQVHYSHEAVKSLINFADEPTIKLAGQLHRLLGGLQDLTMLETWLKTHQLASRSDRAIRKNWFKRLERQRGRIISQYQCLMKAVLDVT